MTALGKHLRRLRETQGKSLRKVAKSIGKSHAYLSHVESGRSPPSDKVLLLLATELGEDPDVMFALVGRIRPALLRIICKRPQKFGVLIQQLKNAPDEVIEQVTREVKDGNW